MTHTHTHRQSTLDKYSYYTLTHRVGRELSFSLVVGIGTLPTPHPQASLPPPPPVLGGGAHSLARERLGESQFRLGGHTLWYSYTYFVLSPQHLSFYQVKSADTRHSDNFGNFLRLLVFALVLLVSLWHALISLYLYVCLPELPCSLVPTSSKNTCREKSRAQPYQYICLLQFCFWSATVAYTLPQW